MRSLVIYFCRCLHLSGGHQPSIRIRRKGGRTKGRSVKIENGALSSSLVNPESDSGLIDEEYTLPNFFAPCHNLQKKSAPKDTFNVICWQLVIEKFIFCLVFSNYNVTRSIWVFGSSRNRSTIRPLYESLVSLRTLATPLANASFARLSALARVSLKMIEPAWSDTFCISSMMIGSPCSSNSPHNAWSCSTAANCTV